MASGRLGRLRWLVAFYGLSLLITIGVMAVRALVPGAPDVLTELREFWQTQKLTTSLVNIIRFAAVQPWAWLIVVFASAPTIAAVVVASARGRGSLRRLVSRLKPWGRPADRGRALRFYGQALAISAAVMGWYYWIGSRHGGPERLAFRAEAIGELPLAIAVFLVASHFTDEGGTLEELGWRGFALPELLEEIDPLPASLMLGTIWMLWHLPREVPGLLMGAPLGPFLHGQLLFLVLTIGLSLLCTYGFLQTGGSVVPAIIIHGGTNVWNKALAEPMYPDLSFGIDPRTVIVTTLAIVVVAAGGLAGSRRKGGAGGRIGGST